MEQLLIRLNGFGKYQKFILFLISLIASLTAFTTYSSIFTIANPELSCSAKGENSSVINSCEIWNSLKLNHSLNEVYECKFSTEYYGNTIITEWGFECDKLYMGSFLQTMFMVGCLFTFIGGWFSDRYGRKFIVVNSAIVLNITILISELLLQKFDLSIE